MTKVIVCGAGGFIGTHLVRSLKEKGYYVIGADLKYPEYSTTDADEFHIVDLRNQDEVAKLITTDVYEIYQFFPNTDNYSVSFEYAIVPLGSEIRLNKIEMRSLS